MTEVEVVPRTTGDLDSAPMTSSAAISTRGLTKRFGSQAAVDSLDLDVPVGTVFGFLGPNGSGKTTTIRMLLGLIEATEGNIEVLGKPMPAGAALTLPRVGALVEGPAFHPYLSGRDNLLRLDAADRTVTGSGARSRVADALDRLGLAASAGKRYRAYSMGMRQRLGLAAALLKPRELLVLDEPTNGLDPQGTREVRAIIRDVGAGGTTVFLSSHLLPEVEQVCSHVGVMSHGRLVFSGSLGEMRAASATRVRIDTPEPAAAAEVLQLAGTGEPEISEHGVVADLVSLASEDLTESLVKAGVPVRQIVVEKPDLEEMFVGLTGEGFDVDE
jgi:ABC-2 type transport system ATP-binding protein